MLGRLLLLAAPLLVPAFLTVAALDPHSGMLRAQPMTLQRSAAEAVVAPAGRAAGSLQGEAPCHKLTPSATAGRSA
jgi:hypothetical protein